MIDYSKLDAVDRLALAEGKPPQTISLSRADALLMITALTNAGQHALAQKLKDGLTWAQ